MARWTFRSWLEGWISKCKLFNSRVVLVCFNHPRVYLSNYQQYIEVWDVKRNILTKSITDLINNKMHFISRSEFGQHFSQVNNLT